MAGTSAMNPTSVRAGHLYRAWWRVKGHIQSELAVFLPSAQTFINITSQPTGRPTSDLKRKREDDVTPEWLSSNTWWSVTWHTWGTLTPARMWTGLRVVWSCVHVNVHLHFIVQDLHELLHGWQVTRLQFGPHRHIWGKNPNSHVKFKTFLSISEIKSSEQLTIKCDFKCSCWHQLVFNHIT